MARLANSLITLRSEINAIAPTRSRVADGWIGDAAHASRASRHNPNRYDVVTALDVTHDPANGCDIHAIAEQIRQNPHPELWHIISNGRIASRSYGWTWRPYTGSNPHSQHVHFGVGTGPDSDPLPPYDSTQPWLNQEDDLQTDERAWLKELHTALLVPTERDQGIDQSIRYLRSELLGPTGGFYGHVKAAVGEVLKETAGGAVDVDAVADAVARRVGQKLVAEG